MENTKTLTVVVGLTEWDLPDPNAYHPSLDGWRPEALQDTYTYEVPVALLTGNPTAHQIAEDFFCALNGHPEGPLSQWIFETAHVRGYRHRSFSVGDTVTLLDADGAIRELVSCESFGWRTRYPA